MARKPRMYLPGIPAHDIWGQMKNSLPPHQAYNGLGVTEEERGFAYRELFRIALSPEQVHAIRRTVQTGTPLGNDRFRELIKRALGGWVGRPHRKSH